MTLTVLATTDGKMMRKTLTYREDGWHKSSYDYAKYYDVIEERDVHRLETLAECLRVIERFPAACVIRGRLRDGVGSEDVQRRCVDEVVRSGAEYFGNEMGEPSVVEAPFTDQPLPWVMIDIDNLAVDPELTMEERHAALIASLPPEFRGADYYYQWSAQAGLDGWRTLRVHLWFWLSKPETSEEMRARAKRHRWKEDYGIDISLFNPVQVHYTAPPLIQSGNDPLDGHPRSGLVKLMRREVILPPWSPPPALVPSITRKAVMVRQSAGMPDIQKWVDAVIQHRRNRIITAAHGAQNGIIYAAARMFGSMVAGGILDETDAKRELLDAADLGGHPRDRAVPTIKSGMRAGWSSPVFGPD